MTDHVPLFKRLLKSTHPRRRTCDSLFAIRESAAIREAPLDARVQVADDRLTQKFPEMER